VEGRVEGRVLPRSWLVGGDEAGAASGENDADTVGRTEDLVTKRKLHYIDYRSFGHTRFTAFVLGSPWWLWLVVIPGVVGIGSLWL
jgi:hypothetical protein